MASYYEPRAVSPPSRRYRLRPQSHGTPAVEQAADVPRSSRHRSQISHPGPPPSSLLPPSTKTRQRSTSNTKVKRTWPPTPAVEDEKASLARELDPPQADADRNPAGSRGTLDQQPVILDVEPSVWKVDPNPAGARCLEPNLFVDIGKQAEPRPQPAARKTAAPLLNLNLSNIPEFTTKIRSPYVFSPKTTESPRPIAADSSYFPPSSSSSSTRTRTDEGTSSDRPASRLRSQTSSSSDALRGPGKARGNAQDLVNTSRPSERVPADVGLGLDLGSSRRSTPYAFKGSFVTQPQSKGQVQTDTTRQKEGLRADGSPKYRLSAHSRSQSSSSLPKTRSTDDSRPSNSSIVNGRKLYFGDASEEYDCAGSVSRRSSTSRPSTPITPVRGSATAPSSPRPSKASIPQSDYEPFQIQRSVRPVSRPNSRPSSPVSKDLPNSPSRYATKNLAISDGWAQRTSRLSTARTADDTAMPAIQRDTSSYSVNSGVSATKWAGHGRLASGCNDYKDQNASLNTTHTQKLRPVSLELGSPSVELDERRTSKADLPTLVVGAARTSFSQPTSPMSARIPVALSLKRLEPCPRAATAVSTTKEYTEWYTIINCPNFSICPACFHNNFEDSTYEKLFKRRSRREDHLNRTCSFSSSWMRLAWLLTRRKQQPNLDLLKQLSESDFPEPPCAGRRSESRLWYTVPNGQGQPEGIVSICLADVKRLESLFPSLKGHFMRSSVARKKGKCELRAESTRFAEYLELLSDIADSSRMRSESPDFSPFIELVTHKSQMKECCRDDLVPDKSWHFVPSLPEFTVCEECYSSVVWPAIADGSAVADSFNRTPMMLHPSRIRSTDRSKWRAAADLGNSCQLYSPRMRRAFMKAVQNEDFDYLAQRARDRREKELELQWRVRELMAQGLRERRVQSELEQVVHEWRKYWE